VATDRTERLLNLVICLLGASRPVGRAALRAGIPGYGDAASDEAFERMFERDKDELRQMGIPVDTVTNAQGEVEGYVIDQDAYALPEVNLDAAELGVLSVAARVWSEAALAAETGAALRKIEAVTGERISPSELLVGRPDTGEAHLPALWEALRHRRPLGFAYLARGREVPEDRVVEPWATVHRAGAWYLVGLSRERGEGRAFRLSRIVGGVVPLPGACSAVDPERVDAAVAGIGDPPPRGVARVILPDRGGGRLRASARLRQDGTGEIDYVDEPTLVALAIEAGASLIHPEGAAELQRQSLARVREIHGERHGEIDGESRA
jgi:proteasome accessory factor B